MVHPSPFNDNAWLLIHAGNTYEREFGTFTVPTGTSSYVAVRGGWTPRLEGDLCMDAVP